MLRKFWSKDGRSAIAYLDWPILASFPTIFLFIIFALSHVGSHVNLAKFWLFSRFSSTFPALDGVAGEVSKYDHLYFETFNWGLQEFCLKTDCNWKVRKKICKIISWNIFWSHIQTFIPSRFIYLASDEWWFIILHDFFSKDVLTLFNWG